VATSDSQVNACVGFTGRVAGNYLDLSVVVLTCFRDVHVVHAVENELVARSLSTRISFLHSDLFKRTHIEHSVPIDEPHDSWLRMTNDTTRESSDSAFLNDDRVWLASKDRSLLGLVFLIRLFWYTVEAKNTCALIVP